MKPKNNSIGTGLLHITTRWILVIVLLLTIEHLSTMAYECLDSPIRKPPRFGKRYEMTDMGLKQVHPCITRLYHRSLLKKRSDEFYSRLYHNRILNNRKRVKEESWAKLRLRLISIIN